MTSPFNSVPFSSQDNSSMKSPDARPQPHILNKQIMVIAILALFWVFFFIISLHIYGRWLWRSRNRSSNAIQFYNQDQPTSAAWNVGLGKATIAQLPTFTYTALTISGPRTDKNAGLLECAVCLSEFQENEKGRLLPSCKHSFHIDCIDMWFYSHSTCPLCRTDAMPTITTSPFMPLTVTIHEQQRPEREEETPQEAHISIETTPSAHDNYPLSATAIPNSGDHLAHAVQIPTNVPFCSNSTQVLPSQMSSSQNSEKPSPTASAKTTRHMPHITIEIPTRQDINMTSPGCLSKPSRRSRCSSPHDAGCSSHTSLKSPGLRESVKRMLSSRSGKGNMVVTSSTQEESMESSIGTTRSQV